MKSIKLLPALSAISLAFLATPSLAQDSQSPSFDNVGISYANVDFGDESSNGFLITAEKSFQEKFFISGNFLNFSESSNFQMRGDNYREKFEISLLHANINYNFFENQGFVAYAGAGISYLEIKLSGSHPDQNFNLNEDDTGWNLIAGVRKSISNNFEVDINIRHMDVLIESEQVFNVGARFYPAARFSINAGYTHIDSDFNYMDLGVSFHF